MTPSDSSSRAVTYRPEPRGRAFALQIVAAQVVASCALSLACLLISKQAALAVLLGGMICSSANLWLAIVAFRPALGKTAAQMLTAFYVGEIGKFVVTALLFLVVFTRFSISKQPIYAFLIFLAYALVQSVVWAYPLARSRLSKSARLGR